MNQPTNYRTSQRLTACRITITCFLGLVINLTSLVHAQDVSPISLIPDTAAGTVRVPNMPEFCEAWKTTTLSAFANDESMKAFVDAQKARAEQELLAGDLKVGIKLRDLLEIASGEAVLAWLPFKDAKRPFSLAVVADIRGLKKEAEKAIDQVDKDLIAGGAKRVDAKYGDDTIRVYTMAKKPGQLKIDEVAITLNDDRIIASDRESVVTGLLDAVSGKSDKNRLVDSPDYARIESQIADRPNASETTEANATTTSPETSADGAGTVGFHWFARPLAMARIVKEAVGIDRGRQVDIVSLLERQGFDAVRAAGGRITIGHEDFDLLHHGFVLAPPVTQEPSKYKLAGRMLQFPNSETEATPSWIGKQTATYTRVNWRMDEAFWAAETLVNDAFGEEVFRDIFDGIRDDEDGPRIDVAKNVIPNLGDHLVMLTDNELPAGEASERLLVAIKVIDAAALRDAVRRAMEVEPDASLIEGVEGTEIFRVRPSDSPTDFDAELFNDLGLDDEPDPDAPKPLLNQWAITVVEVPGQPGGYLVFSSHPELLVETATRMISGAADGLGETAEFQNVSDKLLQIDGKEFSMKRIVRTDLSLRVKYELLREGKLRESDSLLTSLFRRIFENSKEEPNDPLDAKKLPSLDKVQQYFRPAGSFVRTTDDGWQLDGFLLK